MLWHEGEQHCKQSDNSRADEGHPLHAYKDEHSLCTYPLGGPAGRRNI